MLSKAQFQIGQEVIYRYHRNKFKKGFIKDIYQKNTKFYYSLNHCDWIYYSVRDIKPIEIAIKRRSSDET
jgi:hypothetical protein